MKLSDKTCKTAKPKEKPYKLFDGGGLFLEVTSSGSKLWRLKYRYLGKEKRIFLGAYTFLTSINGDGFIRIKNSDKGVLDASHGMDSFYEEFQFNERGDLVLYRGSIDRTD